MPDMQATFSLVLEAKDQASAVLAHVGDAMTRLGQDAEALQKRAAQVGLPKISDQAAFESALRAQLGAVKEHYATQERTAKEGLANWEKAQRETAATALAQQKTDLARQLEAIRDASQRENEVLQRGRRDADAQARSDAAQTLLSNRRLRQEELGELRADVARHQATVLEHAAAERAIKEQAARDDMLRAARDHDQSLAAAKTFLADETALLDQERARAKAVGGGGVPASPDTGYAARLATLASTLSAAGAEPVVMAPEADVSRRTSKEMRAQVQSDYAAMVDAANTAYRARAKAAEDGLEKELATIQGNAERGLAAVKTAEQRKTQAIETAAAAHNTAAREAQRLEQETTRQNYAVLSRVQDEADKAAEASARATAEQQKTATIEGLERTLTSARALYQRGVSALRDAETQETQILRAAGEQQAQLWQKQAADAKRAMESTASSARESGRGITDTFASFGKNFLLWNLGSAALYKLTDGLGSLLGGLVSVNATLEQNRYTFAAIYGNKGAADQAVAWLDHFAEQVPATREEVMQAGLTIASLGDNIGDLLPPLSNIATVMGVDLPRAAQAFSDAQQGRWEMMAQTLHLTKEELIGYGLEVDKSGHILNNSLIPAIERLGNERFGQAAAQQAQHSLAGIWSNVADAFTRLQQTAGKGVFDVLEGNIGRLLKMLQTPAATQWAMAIGAAMGHALQAVINFMEWMGRNFGPPLMTLLSVVSLAWQKLGPIVQGAVKVVESVLSGIGTFLNSDVLPAVQTAIGQITKWWGDHASNVGTIFDNIGKAGTGLWSYLQQTAHNFMGELEGVWEIGWGIVSGILGVAIDVMSGDWKRAKKDMETAWHEIEIGVLKIVNAMIDQIINAFHTLAPAIATVLNAVFVPAFRAAAALAVELMVAMALKIESIFGDMAQNAADKILSIPDKIIHASNKLGKLVYAALGLKPGSGGGASGFGGAGGAYTGADTRDKQIWAQAQAAGTAESSFIGGALGPSPIPVVSFDEQSVTAHVDKWFKHIEDTIDPHLLDHAQKAGKNWWQAFVDALKKHGITLPAAPEKGGYPQPPPTPGIGTGGAQSPEDLSKAYQNAQEAFQLFMERGEPGGYGAGMKLIMNMAAAGHAAGQTDTKVQIETLQDTKQLVTALVDTAKKHFDFDANVAHPSRKKLEKDEAAVLAILSKTPGLSKEDYARSKQEMDTTIATVLKKGGTDPLQLAQQVFEDMRTMHYSQAALMRQVDVIMKAYVAEGQATPGTLHYKALRQRLVDEVTGGSGAAGGITPPTAFYGPYRIATAPYGATQASFGGQAEQSAMAALVAHLRSLVTYWQARAKRDEEALAAQQQTAHNTKQTATDTHRLVTEGRLGPIEARESVPRSAAVAVRNRGGFAPMKPY